MSHPAMTATYRRTAALNDLGAPRRSVDAVTLLTCYLFLLMAIPSALVVGSFGAAGAPAALFAAIPLCFYLAAASILTWRWTASGSQCGLPLFSLAAPLSLRIYR